VQPRAFYVRRLYGHLLRGLIDNAWPIVRASRHNPNLRRIAARDAAGPGASLGTDAALPDRPADAGRPWWQRPGIGVMYQIEARPGWSWQRNFDRFNAALRAPDGGLCFDGPKARCREWVALSQRLGCDYHTFEAKMARRHLLVGYPAHALEDADRLLS
jgi:hypothetical protein